MANIAKVVMREKFEAARKKRATRNGAVVVFLRNNPLSTNAEVFAATGFTCGGNPYVKRCKYKGENVYRINHEKMRKEGLE